MIEALVTYKVARIQELEKLKIVRLKIKKGTLQTGTSQIDLAGGTIGFVTGKENETE